MDCTRDMVSAHARDSKQPQSFVANGLEPPAPDKPDEVLESDAKIKPGHNPVMRPDSPGNK